MYGNIKEIMTEIKRDTDSTPCGYIPSLRDELLKAWRIYSDNPYSKYPCENFKAGWVANMLMERHGFITKSRIEDLCIQIDK